MELEIPRPSVVPGAAVRWNPLTVGAADPLGPRGVVLGSDPPGALARRRTGRRRGPPAVFADHALERPRREHPRRPRGERRLVRGLDPGAHLGRHGAESDGEQLQQRLRAPLRAPPAFAPAFALAFASAFAPA